MAKATGRRRIFGRTVLTAVTPALLKMNELLRRFVEWAKSQLPAVQKAFTDTFGSFDEIFANIEKTLGKPNWKEWFEAIKGLGKDINNVAQWFGRWKNTLELLMGMPVKLGSPIVTAFGPTYRIYTISRWRRSGFGRVIRRWEAASCPWRIIWACTADAA